MIFSDGTIKEGYFKDNVFISHTKESNNSRYMTPRTR